MESALLNGKVDTLATENLLEPSELSRPGLPTNRASDVVAEQLRRMIVTLALPPGAIVTQSDLMIRLNCGRTPLREALQRLSEEYLVIPVPGGGISIASLNVHDFVEVIEALVVVESLSARLAARRITDGQVSKLGEIVDSAEEANREGEFSNVARLDFEFHNFIGQATHNRYLADTIARLHRVATRFGYLAWQRERNASTSLQEHRQILAALQSQDAANAEQLTREHTLKSRDRIVAVL